MALIESPRCEVKEVSKRFVTEGNANKGRVADDGQDYRHLSVLEKVSFDVSKGEFVCIVGPSGCGKSTLLRIIAALEKPSSGEVLIDGNRTSAAGTDSGFIFQNVGLYPWRSALQNTEFFLELRGMNKERRRKVAMEKLELLGLSRFANYYPAQLSGGMQQKVAIARALCIEPSILLMDEPFGSLDALSREKAQTDLLRILANDRERSILFVTHDINEAVFLSDRLIVFSPRPGKIKEIVGVDLGKERWEWDVRADRRFAEYCAQVRKQLSHDMEAGS